MTAKVMPCFEFNIPFTIVDTNLNAVYTWLGGGGWEHFGFVRCFSNQINRSLRQLQATPFDS